MVDADRGFAIPSPRFASRPLTLRCLLPLSKSKEPMAVPTRPRHGLGDLGETAIGLALPGEALIEDHHPLQLPPPFANQERADSECDPFRSLGVAPVERSASASLALALNHPPGHARVVCGNQPVAA